MTERELPDGTILTECPTGMAVFSGDKDRRYRYKLSRLLHPEPSRAVLFVLLNPSEATAFKLDPTVRRCISWAQQWGYHELRIANLFALRSPHPSALLKAKDPVGPLNDQALSDELVYADLVVCGWGAYGGRAWVRPHVEAFVEMARELKCDLHTLGMSWSYPVPQPRHPLARGSNRISDDALPKHWGTGSPVQVPAQEARGG